MAEQLRALPTLSEDLTWVPSLELPVNSAPDALTASSEIHGHLQTHTHTHTQTHIFR